MSFMQLAENRFSVRDYKDIPVEQEKIDMILKAAQLAPTACNNQPQQLIVIQSKEALDKLKIATRCHFDAPLAILVCVNKDECWTRKYDGKSSGFVDGAIVQTYMMLEASELGLGSCWVMHFNPEKMKEQFLLADNLEAVGLLVLGYSKDNATISPLHYQNKNIDDFVEYK